MTQNNIQIDVIILSWNRVEGTIAAIASTAEQLGVNKRIVYQGSDPVTGLATPSQLIPGYLATQMDIIIRLQLLRRALFRGLRHD